MTPNRRLTPEEREAIAREAHDRYLAGETWAQIAADHDLHPGHVCRLVRIHAPVEYRRWGQKPIADVDDVARRRAVGQTLDQIAAALGCSRTAVRTALEASGGTPVSRYPRLSGRRAPTDAEIRELMAMYDACPVASRARPEHRDVRSAAGADLAAACRAIVDDGVPMGTLSRALGRGVTWVHRLLALHDERPTPHPGRTTGRRTRELHDAAPTPPDTPRRP